MLVFGNVSLTTPALQLLLQQGVELALFTRRGRLLGQLSSPFPKNLELRRAQSAKAADPAFCLSAARAIVAGKLANCLALIREFSHNPPETDFHSEADRLAALLPQVASAPDLSSLLGLEGLGARFHYQAFARMVRHAFHFTARRRRPTPDPVNALLSLGYTLVYNEIATLLDGLGFDPFLGFYHQPRYGHATLASDLLEEFRAPLVDRLTLNLINNRVFKPEDFFGHEPSGSVYLAEEPRKRYFQENERLITRPFVARDDEQETAYRRLFRRQAGRLRRTLLTGRPYEPYRFFWTSPMFFAMSYDIRDDRGRLKVARILQDFGERVQLSVCQACLEDSRSFGPEPRPSGRRSTSSPFWAGCPHIHLSRWISLIFFPVRPESRGEVLPGFLKFHEGKGENRFLGSRKKSVNWASPPSPSREGVCSWHLPRIT